MSNTDKISSSSVLENTLLKAFKTHHLKLDKIYKLEPVHASWHMEENRRNDNLHMFYVIDGTGIYHMGNEIFRLKKGQLIFVSNDFSHSGHTLDGHSLSMFSLRFAFHRNDNDAFVPSYFEDPIAISVLSKSAKSYEKLLNKLMESHLEQNPINGFKVNSALSQILTSLCEDASSKDRTDPIKSMTEKIIEQHGINLNIQSLAEDLGLSIKQFTRLFKAYNHVTPHQFIIKTRINYAKYLLEESSLSIVSLALEIGYPDAFSFSKQFKKLVGVAPTYYREQLH